jgi:hypothetical protein
MGEPSPASAAAAAAGFDGKLQSLTQLFEMASSATGVDHPLCLDCAVQLKEEVEAQVWGAGACCCLLTKKLSLRGTLGISQGTPGFQPHANGFFATPVVVSSGL